jgi:hypothetical protein
MKTKTPPKLYRWKIVVTPDDPTVAPVTEFFTGSAYQAQWRASAICDRVARKKSTARLFRLGEFQSVVAEPNTRPNVTPIFVGTKRVGEVVDNTFVKRLRATEHFLRHPPAICFDEQTLFAAIKAKATTVQITDTETGHTFTATIKKIMDEGFQVERGHGRQVGLVLSGWVKDENPAQPKLL